MLTRDCTKKMRLAKKVDTSKNVQFHSKWLKIQAILPTLGLVSLCKFQNDEARNVDFLLVL